ncbi:tetratricopeptide repeat protein [Virgibacillus sp. W0181]|uniref:tetratricopeptide repeat protein n=1 Tax=Virgibacillus sp. W0181 TaxID=3391581 RepID=UPI003F48C302
MQKTSNKACEKPKIISFIPEGDFYFSQGVESFRQGKFKVAVKWLLKAIDKVPDDPLYHSQLAVVYAEIGSFEESNQLLQSIIKKYGEKYIDCHYLLANNYAHLGMFHTARKHAQIYLDHEPEGEFREEVESLLELFEDEDIFQSETDDEFLRYRERVSAYMEDRCWKEALILLEEMRELYPDNQLTKHQYTTALFYSGERDAAIDEELKLLLEDPLSITSYMNLSVYFYEINEQQSFLSMTNVLRNVYPINEEKKLQMAITLSKTALYDEAYARFCLIKNPTVKNQISYYRWFSLAAYHAGKVEIADTIFKKGCQHYPNLKAEEKWR